MPAGVFRPCFAAAFAVCLAAAPGGALATSAGSAPGRIAAPASRGTLVSPSLRGARLGTYGVRGGFGRVAGTRFDRNDLVLGRRKWRGDRFAFGYGAGYGGFFGFPFGLDAGYPDGPPLGFPEDGLVPSGRPEWPSSIGIAPSPVQPPVLYVIGRDSPASASSGRRSASRPAVLPRVVTGSVRVEGADLGREVAAPRFIRVPSDR